MGGGDGVVGELMVMSMAIDSDDVMRNVSVVGIDGVVSVCVSDGVWVSGDSCER